MLYVGASGEEYQQFLVGEEAFLTIPSREAVAEQVQVVPPSGEDLFVPVRPYESGVSISVDELRETGIYKVKSGEKEIARFAANMDGRESDLEATPEDEFRDLFVERMEEPGNFTILDSDDDIFEVLLQSRVGLELWRYMLALALLCAFAEMIVGRGRQGDEIKGL